MLVWENVKKVSLGGMFVGAMMLSSLSLTGCLTDDKTEDPPADNSKALTAEKKDTIWNLQGPNKGAYNLVTGAQVGQSEASANKDLVDMAVLSGGSIAWPKTLTSLNGTTFVTAPSGFDYAAATDSTVIKAFVAGTASPTSKVLADGDVILAKVRGGSTYAAIKAYKVAETASDNKDYINFGFRLTP